MAAPPGWAQLGFTSGRRTHRGNRLVGGVPNSDHLDGTAADFTAPVSVLRQRFGPNVRILDEKDHRHVSGLSDVPYYGNRGIAGLVNGVDTSAPKGQQMRRPDPITRSLMPNYLQMSMPQNGVDPLAPQQQPMGVGMGMMQPTPQGPPPNGGINFAAMSQPNAMGRDPLAPKPKAFGKGGAGWAILGAIGDAMSAYGGRPATYAPMMMSLMDQQREEGRFRQKLGMEHELRMKEIAARSAAPPKMSQTERMAAAVLDPRTPDPQRKLYMQILTKPFVSVGADGSAVSSYDTLGPVAGSEDDDEWSYN